MSGHLWLEIPVNSALSSLLLKHNSHQDQFSRICVLWPHPQPTQLSLFHQPIIFQIKHVSTASHELGLARSNLQI